MPTMNVIGMTVLSSIKLWSISMTFPKRIYIQLCLMEMIQQLI